MGAGSIHATTFSFWLSRMNSPLSVFQPGMAVTFPITHDRDEQVPRAANASSSILRFIST
jgi:hypothetical protein